MDEIKRGLVMIVVPIAVLCLVYTVFWVGEGIFWVQAIVGLIYICTMFLGSFSFFIGLIHLIGGTYSVLKVRASARAKDA